MTLVQTHITNGWESATPVSEQLGIPHCEVAECRGGVGKEKKAKEFHLQEEWGH